MSMVQSPSTACEGCAANAALSVPSFDPMRRRLCGPCDRRAATALVADPGLTRHELLELLKPRKVRTW